MRKRTVRHGINLILAGVVAVTVATFFHEKMAFIFSLTPDGETRFVFLGLFWGGVAGGFGILTTIIGILRRPSGERDAGIMPSLILLASAIIIFFILLFFFVGHLESPGVRPGETINI